MYLYVSFQGPRHQLPAILDKVFEVPIQCVFRYHPSSSGLWYNFLRPYKNWRISFFLNFLKFLPT